MLIFALLAMPLISAEPQIQLINQINPLELGNIQTITLNIITNETLVIKEIEFDYQNHTLQKQGELYVYLWKPTTTGILNYKIYATDNKNQTSTLEESFTVQDTTPPHIIGTNPTGKLDYNLVEIRIITDENSTCKYDTSDVTYDSMALGLSGSGTIHTKLRSLSEGKYKFYTSCKDLYNNIATNSVIEFTIDTKPPTILNINPTGTITDPEITMSFNTDEIATCKWSTTNQGYETMSNMFSTTGATRHEQPMTLEEGINTYYLSCKDEIGNANNPLIINLELNRPPTAVVKLNKENEYTKVSSGTYEITLETSEQLISQPYLALKFGRNIQEIGMQGSGTSWNGYLILSDSIGEAVGEFLFKGKDKKGTQGTEITDGKLVLIDTKDPLQPKGLNLKNQDNKIMVSWLYEGEEINHFNIYRSTTGKTDQTDFKTATFAEQYADVDVEHNIGYFYRISAVDNAGNEGLLSEEEFIMTKKENNTAVFTQDPEILSMINTKLSGIENLIREIEVKIAELEGTSDQDVLLVVNDLNLIAEQQDVKTSMQSLIGELKVYKETSITKQELVSKISVIDAKIGEYQKKILFDVRVQNKVETEQILEENLLQETINEYLETTTLTSEQRALYNEKTKSLQQEARIKQQLIKYELVRKNQEVESIIIIKETILFSSELKNVLVQEVLPKEVIKVSDIEFDVTPKALNKKGALWSLRALPNSEVKYKTLQPTNLADLRSIKTLLLYDIEQFLSDLSSEELENTVTGEVTKESTGGFSFSNLWVLLGVAIILGLLGYYFLYLKPEHYDNQLINNINNRENGFLSKINVHESERLIKGIYQDDFLKNDLQVILGFVQMVYQALEEKDLEIAQRQYSLALSCYYKAKLGLKSRLKANYELNTARDKFEEVLGNETFI